MNNYFKKNGIKLIKVLNFLFYVIFWIMMACVVMFFASINSISRAYLPNIIFAAFFLDVLLFILISIVEWKYGQTKPEVYAHRKITLLEDSEANQNPCLECEGDCHECDNHRMYLAEEE